MVESFDEGGKMTKSNQQENDKMNYSMERIGMVYVGVEGGRIVYRREHGDGRRVTFKDWDEVRQFVADAKNASARPDICVGCVHRCVSCGGYPLDYAMCRKEKREAGK